MNPRRTKRMILPFILAHRRKLLFFGFLLFVFLCITPYIWSGDGKVVPFVETDLGESELFLDEDESELEPKIIAPSTGTAVRFTEPEKNKKQKKKKKKMSKKTLPTAPTTPTTPYKPLFTVTPAVSKDTDFSTLPEIPMRDIETKGIIGIKNRGNSCYANSVLQTAFRVPALRRLLANFEVYRLSKNDVNKSIKEANVALVDSKDQESSKGVISSAISELNLKESISTVEGLNHMFHQLQSKSDGAADFSFEKTEQCMSGVFHSYGQEDAFEFMNHLYSSLLDFLPEQQRHYISIRVILERRFLSKSPLFSFNHNKVTSTKYDWYDAIIAPIPEGATPDLISLLKAFFSYDTADDVKFEGEIGQSICKPVIQSLPDIVPIQLKRFERVDAADNRKIYTPIEIPALLDLSPYCDPKLVKNALYRLKMFIEHRGDFTGGHYVAYSLEADGNWYLLDDSIVSQIPLAKSSERSSYMHVGDDGKIYEGGTCKTDIGYIYFYERIPIVEEKKSKYYWPFSAFF